jgi:hypothetical protein
MRGTVCRARSFTAKAPALFAQFPSASARAGVSSLPFPVLRNVFGWESGTLPGVQKVIRIKVLPICCHFDHRKSIMRFAQVSFPFLLFSPNFKLLAHHIPPVLSRNLDCDSWNLMLKLIRLNMSPARLRTPLELVTRVCANKAS